MSLHDTTCWTVIRGAARGRAADREEFARRYEAVIRAYLGARWRHTPIRHEIDDAVQDTFVDCFREGGALGRADPAYRGGFRAFLYGVVRNVARRIEEKRVRRRERQPDTSFDVDAEEESLSKVFDRAWAKALVREALRLQGEQARERGEVARRRLELLHQRFAEGRPMREIAEAWGVNANKVQYEYARARDEFEAALCEVVRRHHPDGGVEAECAHVLACLGEKSQRSRRPPG